MDRIKSNSREYTIKTALLTHSITEICGPKLQQMKFVLGVSALLLVDIIWVASSQLTRVSLLVGCSAALLLYFN